MSEELGRAFARQAGRHLQRDFLPKVRRCLELLGEEELWWRAHGNSNSAGNLVLHMCGNLRQWVISGVGGEEDRRQRDREFAERGPIPLAALLGELERTVGEAVDVLEGLDPEELLRERTIQIYRVTGLQAIFHAVEHFSHHTGQIIYITKLRRNLDLKFYNL